MTVLITGSARGLGLELCKTFLDQGHRVIGLSRSKSSDFQNLLEEYSEERLTFIQTDVSQEDQVMAAVTQVRTKTTGLDILINNAAVHLEQNPPDINEIDFSHYLQTFAINSVAPLIMIKHFLPLLRAGATKSIINISSEAGSITDCGRDREYSYCMSKAALNMAMKILHNRLGDEDFRVQLIHPGWVRTDMGGHQADLSAQESAKMVFQQIMTENKKGDALYIDWKGEKLPW